MVGRITNMEFVLFHALCRYMCGWIHVDLVRAEFSTSNNMKQDLQDFLELYFHAVHYIFVCEADL